MNAGVSEIDAQEQAAARLNEIVEELPIIEHRRSNELLLPESHSLVSRYRSSPIGSNIKQIISSSAFI